MKNCEMCGAEIPTEDNICPKCGGIVSDDAEENRIIGNPDWGRINIYLNLFPCDMVDLFDKIKLHWKYLEGKSAQRLFSGQLDKNFGSESTIALYGPRESFISLSKMLISLGVNESLLDFNAMSYDEIYQLRDSR